MAKNPYVQLGVLKRAIEQGRKLKDCFRLLYHASLWQAANPNMKTSHTLPRFIDPLKKGQVHVILNDQQASSYLLETLHFLLINIFSSTLLKPMMNTKELVLLSLSNDLQRQEATCWMTNRFMMTPAMIERSQFLKQLSFYIDDHRFLKLIANVMKRSLHLKKKRLGRLFLNLYLAPLDRYCVDLKTSVSLFYVRVDGEWLMAVNESLALTKQLAQKLSSFLICELKQKDQEKMIRVRQVTKPLSFLQYELTFQERLQRTIPKTSIEAWLKHHRYGMLAPFCPKARRDLLYLSEREIYDRYVCEKKAFEADYRLITVPFPNGPINVMRESFIATIAAKRKQAKQTVKQSMITVNHTKKIALRTSCSTVWVVLF